MWMQLSHNFKKTGIEYCLNYYSSLLLKSRVPLNLIQAWEIYSSFVLDLEGLYLLFLFIKT